MNRPQAIAIFDIGKTNKKLFVFDEQYGILLEKSVQLAETADEDGDACEDIAALTHWVKQSLAELVQMNEIQLGALNFSTYGASLVHVNSEGKPVTPLYNYLKPFPEPLKERLYEKYGGAEQFAMQTASPLLGNLNSGLQLYYLKEEKPELFNRIHLSLHLPQYMSWLVTGRSCSDITSIGCHTAMWNFSENRYHEWLYSEGIAGKLAPVFPSDRLMPASWEGRPLPCGAGLHDSSAALIPYLAAYRDPFVLISTGTWCISLNPFNQTPLTAEELQQDCLCYMEYRGRPVKASRLFAGYEHEQQVKRLAAHFNVAEDNYRNIVFDASIVPQLDKKKDDGNNAAPESMLAASGFSRRDLAGFSDYNHAYHQLILDMMQAQVRSTRLVLRNSSVKKIFVDGGFGKNQVYMNLLAAAFRGMEVYAASVPQASALGAALAVHPYWNSRKDNTRLVEVQSYRASEYIQL